MEAKSPNNSSGFTPAPNPFEQPEEQNESQDADEQNQDTAQHSSGVSLVGKTLEQRQAEQVEPQKKSFIKNMLGLDQAKKKQEKEQPQQHKVAEETLISWQAPEFVQTIKPAGWFIGVGLFFAVLIVIAILTRQYITVGLFALMGVALVIYANRSPRVLNYQITNYGIYVGEKKYLFDDFSSYYEANDYGQPVIELVPNKRVGTLVSVPPKTELIEEIEDTLSRMLPKVDNKEDVIDKLFRKLRF